MSKSVAREKINLLSEYLCDVLVRDVKKQGNHLREFSAGRSTSIELEGVAGVATLTLSFKVR